MPRKRDHAAPFVAPIRLRNLMWVPVVAGCWAAMELYGTPHLRVRTEWSGRSDAPYYHACDYWGLHEFRVRPSDGVCPMIRLARGAGG